MSTPPASHGWEYPWESYTVHRPKYPQSLWDRILSYHQEHNGHFDSVHDVGAGAGQASAVLAHHFEIICVTEPSGVNMSTAMAKLESIDFLSSITHPIQYTYTQAPAEEARLAMSVDMVTFFESIHWTDAERSIRQVTRDLKPNGTLALVFYNAFPYVSDNDTVDRLWKQIFAGCFAKAAEAPKLRRPIEQGNVGLDFVPLPADLYREGARRTNINCRSLGSKAFLNEFGEALEAPSRVGPTDVVEEIEDLHSWSKIVGADWFEAYLGTVITQFDLEDEKYGQEKELFHEMTKTLESREVTVTWSAAIVLATRKTSI
ncbi:hypothetical protein K402DRAFT_416963 [Aulographum hederae CBS 113979]|uniref:Methyltransferase type 11 domain-containing protein n=1 Tax=Aulographum hederae CBS 113979 TaxID=1176131 RepID=A0A6G1HFI0_9PEZI|nr:hypothetical protein K402DRAFT_416963 [Aulographum hederae CBS 113979]